MKVEGIDELLANLIYLLVGIERNNKPFFFDLGYMFYISAERDILYHRYNVMFTVINEHKNIQKIYAFYVTDDLLKEIESCERLLMSSISQFRDKIINMDLEIRG